jgi:predicted nucleic acid-binding protein
VILELRKGARCLPAVHAWPERVPPIACYIRRISLAEIHFGIERVAGPASRAELDAWDQDGVLPWFGARVLEVDEPVLLRGRRLIAKGRRANGTGSQPDALLAATARVHHLGITTRNGEEFVRSGVRIVNPWEGSG